jgi:hypothetical protein
MPYALTVCRRCERAVHDVGPHGPADEYCEGEAGYERVEAFTAHEVQRRLLSAEAVDAAAAECIGSFQHANVARALRAAAASGYLLPRDGVGPGALPEMLPDQYMDRAARLVEYVGRGMGAIHASLSTVQLAAVFEMLEAAGERIERADTPTLDDVAAALRDEDLHDEAYAYWTAPADGEPEAHEILAGTLTWLADFLPQHIAETREAAAGA